MKKWIAALFFWSISIAAWADCGLTLHVNNVTVNWTLDYTHQAVQFSIDKANSEACDFGVAFTKGGAANYTTRRVINGTKTLRYQLFQDSGLTNILKDKPDITGVDDVIMSGFPEGTNLTQNLNYYFQIPYADATSPLLVSNGTYTDTFTVNVYLGSDPLTFGAPVATGDVTVTVNVPQMIKLSLVSSGGPFDPNANSRSVAFGLLSQGESNTFDVRVRTNAGFNVTYSSLNNGVLKHVTETSTVPYSLYVNSVLLDMSNSNAVPVLGLSGAGQTSLSGLGYPIKVVVGAVSGLAAGGQYTDTVTVSAITTE